MMKIRRGVYFLALVAICSTLSCSFWFFGRKDAPLPIDPEETREMPCRRAPASGLDVRWVELDGAADRAALSEWCHTVGPVVAVSDSESNDPPAVDSIAFVTWNTYVGGGDLVRLVRDLRGGALTAGVAPEHFVLLLQEVFRTGADVPTEGPQDFFPERIEKTPPSGRRNDIVEAAETLGLNHFYVPSMRNGSPGSGDAEEDRGNAILSTLPLHDLTAIELPFERFRRVAAAVTIQCATPAGDLWNLRVCCTHLDTRTRFPRFFESAGVGRGRQAKALVESLPETPAVLGGDFNTWALESMESALEVVRERFRHPEHPDESPTVALTLLPDRRLDHLFFDLPEGYTAYYTRLDDTYGSDHYPLLGFIQLATHP